MQQTTTEPQEQMVTVRLSELTDMIARLVQAEVLLELRDSVAAEMKAQMAGEPK